MERTVNAFRIYHDHSNVISQGPPTIDAIDNTSTVCSILVDSSKERYHQQLEYVVVFNVVKILEKRMTAGFIRVLKRMIALHSSTYPFINSLVLILLIV